MKKFKLMLFTMLVSILFVPSVFALSPDSIQDEDELNTCLSTANNICILSQDINLASTYIEITNEVTINLNGHNITGADSKTAIYVNSGNLTLTGNGTVKSNIPNNGVVFLQSGTLNVKGNAKIENTDNGFAIISQSSTINISENASIINSGTEGTGISIDGSNSALNITGGTISATGDAITVFGTNSNVTISGGNIKAKYFAISGNGSQTTNSTITIKGGNLESTDSAAIYHPQEGTLTIEDGDITGKIGIVARQGTIDIKGGKITANGEEGQTAAIGDATEGDSNPQLPLGTAVIVDNKSEGYSSNPAKVKIEGGEFDTTADPVSSYGDTPTEIDVEGGKFNKPVPTTFISSEDKHYVDFIIDGTHNYVYANKDTKKLNSDDIPKPTKSGYSFINWYNESTFDTIFDTTSEITENKTVYARFTKNSSVTKYYVEFVVEGETPTTIYVRSGRTIDESDIPTYKKEGFKLDGWYLDKEYTKKFDFTTGVTGNITLYAKYTKDDVIDENPKTLDNIATYITLGILSFGTLIITSKKLIKNI